MSESLRRLLGLSWLRRWPNKLRVARPGPGWSLRTLPNRKLISPQLIGSKRMWSALAVIGMVVSLVSVALTPATTQASYVDLLANGGFENGFASQAGCGMVGSGWGCFTNGGAANYGFYDDQWERTVAAGRHSQLLEINTKNIMVGDPDRYSGIYQTVPVANWAQYTLSLVGMIRTTNVNGEDPWRYRVQVGWTFGPQANWQAVTNWTDVGWDTYYERTNPGSFSSYSTGLTAAGDYMTVYIRVWKKWGVPNEELDVNFDNISLLGPSPYAPEHPWGPKEPSQPGCADPCPPVQTLPAPVTPVQPACATPCQPVTPLPPVGACVGPNLVYNGDFEGGFYPVAVGHVGNSWGYFTNGGAANYGFYDDQWPPVVASGSHAQLIEINTKGIYPADENRYAGIYQYLTGLQPGVTYEFRMKGLLRGAGNEDDPYRFSAQWGYAPGYQPDFTKVSTWNEMNLGPIGVRTNPGPVAEYTMQFTAPASDLTLFIRGWKKWAITNVEMDFNIDSVSVRSCLLYGTGGPVVKPLPQPEPWPEPGCADPCGQPVYPDPVGPVCSYTVQPGDTLSWIAQNLGVSQWDLIAANGIANPNLVFVGQVLVNPACGVVTPQPLPEPVPVDPGCGGDPCGATPYAGVSYADAPALAYDAGPGELPPGGYAADDATVDWSADSPVWGEPAQPVAADPGCGGGPCGTGGAASGAASGGYTVRRGDNLSTIAATYGISVRQLMQANGIANPNIIYVGQQLVIP